MTQQDLAEKADMSNDTIKRIESGIRGMSLDTFLSIADALKVEPALLLSENSKDMLPIEKVHAILSGRSKAEQDYLVFMMEKLVEGLCIISN